MYWREQVPSIVIITSTRTYDRILAPIRQNPKAVPDPLPIQAIVCVRRQSTVCEVVRVQRIGVILWSTFEQTIVVHYWVRRHAIDGFLFGDFIMGGTYQLCFWKPIKLLEIRSGHWTVQWKKIKACILSNNGSSLYLKFDVFCLTMALIW